MQTTPHSLEKLTAEQLLAQTRHAVTEERRWTQTLIEHLAECDRRGLHLKLGMASLHEFAVKYLGLSDGAAHRRIQAMRLTQSVPEVAAQVRDGSLPLSHAAKLQTFFQAEKKANLGLSLDKKREWILESQKLSTRELDRKIIEASSEPARARILERTREISPTLSELKLMVSPDFLEKIEKIKDFLGHALPGATTAQVLERLLDAELTRQQKARGLEQNPIEEKPRKTPSASTQKRPTEITASPSTNEPCTRKSIPAAIRRTVWRRARGQCEFRSSVLQGQRCSARRTLEVDHIRPVSLQGSSELLNLQLLCRSHNGIRVPRWN